MNKIELLAPAGNLEKAKIALWYGADAVYVGGKQYSLRARASNFTMDDIKALCMFAKTLHKKVYVTTNILPHNEDFVNLDEYLCALADAGVTGIIASSLALLKRAKAIAPRLERHVSTQMSITNGEAISFWQQVADVSRVVLAREMTLSEIQAIKTHTEAELEVFIHGGMCASYSGRCVLSNHMTYRDANRGGCAHSCRWNYRLYQNKQLLTNEGQYFNMGSKDLMALRFVPALIDLGVASLKIEGRMKSTYYLATVVRCYRKLIDLYQATGTVTAEAMDYLATEIAKAENRLTSCGFLGGETTLEQQLYDTRSEHPTKEYIGDVLDYDVTTGIATIQQRNYFVVGDLVEFFGPTIENQTMVVEAMTDAITGETLAIARHPLQQLKIKVPFLVQPYDMMRKVK